ncbi:beta-phosphoglucomutase-like phosphatase (HAD superfamily) [Arthrobacter sp. PL16]|uniref:HAD family phosphatase n=1 Tax=Arthrobacter sp. PL16 TaxID=3071720 RepID=UPI002E07CCF1|nr:beta-phosphoglucomutase-like phosphatase (HAD superfamily) [Arthrobacter sp. PL16]
MVDWGRDSDELISAMITQGTGARVIWDFDGVVAHTEPLHEDSFRELARRRGYRFADDFFADLIGNTEHWIWCRLIERGFPAETGQIQGLYSERAVVVAEAAKRSLEPSWVASRLMPALSGVAAQQTVVSNGNPDLIEELLQSWNLARYVDVARRGPTEDKEVVFRAHCLLPCVVLEDSDHYLGIGRELGAFTVGVRHSHNPRATLNADVTTAL